jgi:nitrite reductase (NADH) small subunit
VISRGIVGSRGAAASVASPTHKDVFGLRTGACLTGTAPDLPAYLVLRHRGLVFRAPRETPHNNEGN